MFYECSVDVLFPGANVKLFRGGGPYHIETSPLICSANQWSGFYMIMADVMKELKINFVISKMKLYLMNVLLLNTHGATSLLVLGKPQCH